MLSTPSSFIPILLLLLLLPCFPARRLIPSYAAPPAAALSEIKNPTHPWHDFERFLDAPRGTQINGISELKKYLHHFGYLNAKDLYNITDVFDFRLENALTRYQSRLGLSVTGKLDSATISEMSSPRCGVPDAPRNARVTRHYAYFTGQPRWSRSSPMTLTYAFTPKYMIIPSLSQKEIKEAFQRAFGKWASVIPVKFVETEDNESADIKIGFYHGDHGDDEPFDGVLGVLAHAFSPVIGKFHLDAAETWAVDFGLEKSNVAIDLESVAIHEIGHLLGLVHSDDKDAVMYPSLRPRERKVELRVDDIKGIQALYGSNPNFSFKAYSESDISTSPNAAAENSMRKKRSSAFWSFSMLMFLGFFI